MSQARRSRVGVKQRHRQQVARFIVDVSHKTETGQWREHRTADGPVTIEIVFFDVSAVREAAEAMLRDAEAVDDVFRDWTRTLGLGPENSAEGAFDTTKETASVVVAAPAPRNGWASFTLWGQRIVCPVRPGYPDRRDLVAIDLGIQINRNQTFARMGVRAIVRGTEIHVTSEHEKRGGWPGRLARHPDNPCPSWAPMARARIRLAKRVLAEIEGMASECEACGGVGRETRSPSKPEVAMRFRAGRVIDDWSLRVTDGGYRAERACQTCQGTGHNRRGTLPPLRPSTCEVRWTEDALRSACASGGDLSAHQSRILNEATDASWRLDPGELTRVTGRGQHRMDCDQWPKCEQWDCCLDQRINGRGWRLRVSPVLARDGNRPAPETRLPRWRRGELHHDRRRGRRACS